MRRRRRFSGDLKAKVALEALRGDRTAAGDCLEAPGSSEPGEHMEAPSDRRAWRGVLERCGPPSARP